MKAMQIVYGVVGLLVGIYILKAVLPLLFHLNAYNATTNPSAFSNSTVWGSFGAAILPTIFPLILAAAVLFIIIVAVTSFIAKNKGGKGGYGL